MGESAGVGLCGWDGWFFMGDSNGGVLHGGEGWDARLYVGSSGEGELHGRRGKDGGVLYGRRRW
eukprot:CAMPEP_0196593334 /NCGR_PEP_ID=MMETSP1081-20130531/75366_1 /TAXON_ID=36882 /ORGANISM="Pyramimonas amylifera, Strain CCMP720" /LENGTH=63 /DNA_ID=CAMNT_0041917291 /DNA_START=367 /DNA_END=555 /DNA_ORIENTATION=-